VFEKTILWTTDDSAVRVTELSDETTD
jgi:hypothetical protein